MIKDIIIRRLKVAPSVVSIKDGTLTAGTAFSALIDNSSGMVWAWGLNLNGQLGDNSTTQRVTPVSVAGAVKTFCKISAGFNHTVAIDKNGRAWAWGGNINGQLGDNSITSRRTPVSVLGAVKTFCQIAAGGNHTVAIDKNGRVWAWGANTSGILGDNSTTQRLTPVSVAGAVKTFCQIAAGGTHTIGLDKNGMVWGWGANTNGRLGDGTTTSRLTPVSVAGAVKTFCNIAVGFTHTIGLDKNGMVWGWGANTVGQLGDNSTTQRVTPVSVLGAVKTFCQIGASLYTSFGIDKNGTIWGWGLNDVGQIGDNSGNRLTPVQVCNI